MAFLTLAGCHNNHGSASYDGISHINFAGWPWAIDCDGSAPGWPTPTAIRDNFDAMCSFADNFFENECSQGVGAFGIKMKDEVDPETGEIKKVLDEANSTTHCGSTTLPNH